MTGHGGGGYFWRRPDAWGNVGNTREIAVLTGIVTFAEKGGKVISKPMPAAYLAILHAAVAHGGVDPSPSAYVVPMERRQRLLGERDDRIIWRVIKRLGARAGVEVFPHALQHAFSVRFLEQHRARSRRFSVSSGTQS